MLRRVMLPLFLLLATLLPASAAWSCSCAMPVPEEIVASSEGPVFVGTVIGHDVGPPGEFGEQQVVVTFEVERVLSGELHETLTIQAEGDSGANCGLMLEVGARVGMQLFPSGDRWTSNSCGVHDPDSLLAVSEGEEPLPDTSVDAAGDEDESGSSVPWVPLGGTVVAALAAVGGIALLARRRRTGS